MQHWSLVVSYATPETASRCDSDGLLPLHWACSGSPTEEAVQSLLQAYPPGASHTDQEGSTALHFACHYGASLEVVQLLLRENPDAVAIRDAHGRTPLHHAVTKSASLEILQALVQTNPSTITVPQKLGKRSTTGIQIPLPQRTPLFAAWHALARDRRALSQKSGKLWDKAEYLLQATYNHNHQSVSNSKFEWMVHAAVEYDRYLPPKVMEHVLDRYPKQLLLRDEVTGRLPLAIAAASHQLSSRRSRELICLLLDRHPQALTQKDQDGAYPLTLAMASGQKTWDSGVGELWRGAPDLIHELNGPWKLFPTLTMAAASSLSPQTDEQGEDENVEESEQFIFHSPAIQGHNNTKNLEWEREAMNSMKKYHRQRNQEQSNEIPQLDWNRVGKEERQLSTVFALLQANPSIVQT